MVSSEDSEFVKLLSVCCDENSATALHCADHAINMVMTHSADGELDRIARLGVWLRGRRDCFMCLAFGCGAQCKCALWKSREQACGSQCLEERAAIQILVFHEAFHS